VALFSLTLVVTHDMVFLTISTFFAWVAIALVVAVYWHYPDLLPLKS
jgi:hypothetical protein